MESLQRWLVTMFTVILACLIATGIANAQQEDGSLDAIIENMRLGNLRGARELRSPLTSDPYSGGPYAGNMLANLLKRNYFPGNYRRTSRIKHQRIIPFYSYGNEVARYRAMPRYGSVARTPFVFKPWNMESIRPSKFLNTQIYGGYGLEK